MRADSKTYEAVANRCDAYSAKAVDSTTNSSADSDKVSCTSCTHFTNDSYCDLDLYDQIVTNHKMD